MAQLGLGSIGIQESLEGILAPLPTLVEGKFFRMATFANLFELVSDFIEGFVPGDPFPFSLTTFSHSF